MMYVMHVIDTFVFQDREVCYLRTVVTDCLSSTAAVHDLQCEHGAGYALNSRGAGHNIVCDLTTALFE